VSKPLQILHVIFGLDPRLGGPPAALEGLTQSQIKLGQGVTVVSNYRSNHDDSLAARMRARGVKVHLVGPCRTPLQLAPGMNTTVRKLVAKADVVHIHTLYEQLQYLAVRASIAAKKPYFIRPCGMLAPWCLAQSALRKKIYIAWRLRSMLNGAAAIHFTTADEKERAEHLQLKPPTIVEPNGIHAENFTRDIDPIHKIENAWPQTCGCPTLVFYGRLHPKKGADVLIQAFSKLLQKWPADSPMPKLVMVGPDEDQHQKKLEALAQDTGCQQHIIFTGMLTGDAAAGALQSADLFVLTSHQENFGIAVVEALAAGTPVVVSDQVNIYDKIVAGGVGAAVRVDPEHAAQVMMQWLTDHTLRNQAAQKATAWADTTYGWNQIAHRWVHQHYPEAINSSNNQPS